MSRINEDSLQRDIDIIKMFMNFPEKKELIIKQLALNLSEMGSDQRDMFMNFLNNPEKPIKVNGNPCIFAPGVNVRIKIKSLWNTEIMNYHKNNKLIDINGYVVVEIHEISVLNQDVFVKIPTKIVDGLVISSIIKIQQYYCKPIELL
jgi:hypothetical protein